MSFLWFILGNLNMIGVLILAAALAKYSKNKKEGDEEPWE